MKSRSIVRQWLSATLMTLLLVWLAVVLSVAWVIRHETDEIFDAGLQETAQRLLPLAVMQLRTPHVKASAHDQTHDKRQDTDDDPLLESDEGALEPAQHDEYLVYQVFHANGRMLLRSHAAPVSPLTQRLLPGFHNTAVHRIYVEKSRNGEFMIALAEKATHRRSTLNSTLKFLLMPLLALLPLTALGMLLIVRRASLPLQQLGDAMAQRSSTDLHPVPADSLPIELQPLADNLNQLMQRLTAALEAERHFTANSAHELRTPLAAAMAQLDVLDHSGLNEVQTQRVDTVRQLLQRLQVLSEKLLQLARAESGMAWKMAEVDLAQLLKLLCHDRQWQTDHRLNLVLPATVTIVRGDVDALGIVLGNLLENAIRYASPDSSIQIELQTHPVRIRIVNDCEPLHSSELERLHERFYRAKPDSRGTGLGLSIVRALLAPSAIVLELHSPARGHPRGFEACLRWPDDASR